MRLGARGFLGPGRVGESGLWGHTALLGPWFCRYLVLCRPRLTPVKWHHGTHLGHCEDRARGGVGGRRSPRPALWAEGPPPSLRTQTRSGEADDLRTRRRPPRGGPSGRGRLSACRRGGCWRVLLQRFRGRTPTPGPQSSRPLRLPITQREQVTPSHRLGEAGLSSRGRAGRDCSPDGF